MSRKIEGTIAGVIEPMLSGFEAEEVDLYRRVISDSEIKEFKGYEQFYFALIYPFEKFINGYIREEISSNNDVAFILQNCQFIESNFKRLIQEIEGFPCCVDKSRTIMKSLINSYKTGKDIAFNYDQEYTYSLPEKIFKTHNSIKEFYEGLKGLYYGQHGRYLKALKNVTEECNGDQECPIN